MGDADQLPLATTAVLDEVSIDADLISVVDQSNQTRSHLRRWMVTLAAMSLVAFVALLVVLDGHGAQYSLAEGAKRAEASARFSVRTTVTIDGEAGSTVFSVDADRRLLDRDSVGPGWGGQIVQSHQIVDLRAKMSYVAGDRGTSGAGWLGGPLSSTESEFWGGQLDLGARMGRIVDSVGAQRYHDLGLIQVDASLTRHYQATAAGADLLAAQPQLAAQFGDAGLTLAGTLVSDVFVSKSNDLARITMTGTVNGTPMFFVWDQFAYGDDVTIEVPTDFVDMSARP